MARVLAVELAGSVEAEIGAQTVGVGRRTLATGLGREERGPALLAGQADVGSRARIACTPDRTAIQSRPHKTQHIGKDASSYPFPHPLLSLILLYSPSTLILFFLVTPRPVPVRQRHGNCVEEQRRGRCSTALLLLQRQTCVVRGARRPMKRPLVSKARPASMVMSRVANMVR